MPVYVDRSSSRRRAGLILGVSGVAVLAGTGVYGLIRRRDFFASDPGSDREKALQKEVQIGGTIAFIVGCGAVVAGVAIYLTAPGKEQISDGTAFSPVITNEQIGFAVNGSF